MLFRSKRRNVGAMEEGAVREVGTKKEQRWYEGMRMKEYGSRRCGRSNVRAGEEGAVREHRTKEEQIGRASCRERV